jgi:hypothetical protein
MSSSSTDFAAAAELARSTGVSVSGCHCCGQVVIGYNPYAAHVRCDACKRANAKPVQKKETKKAEKLAADPLKIIGYCDECDRVITNYTAQSAVVRKKCDQCYENFVAKERAFFATTDAAAKAMTATPSSSSVNADANVAANSSSESESESESDDEAEEGTVNCANCGTEMTKWEKGYACEECEQALDKNGELAAMSDEDSESDSDDEPFHCIFCGEEDPDAKEERVCDACKEEEKQEADASAPVIKYIAKKRPLSPVAKAKPAEAAAKEEEAPKNKKQKWEARCAETTTAADEWEKREWNKYDPPAAATAAAAIDVKPVLQRQSRTVVSGMPKRKSVAAAAAAGRSS